MRCFQALLVLMLLFGQTSTATAGGVKSAKCPRCETRYVTRIGDVRAPRNGNKTCRVCLEERGRFSGYLEYRLETAQDEGARREVRKEWERVQRELKAIGYEVGEIGGTAPPRLLPIEKKVALAFALFDEAQRFQRRALWSGQMADALTGGKALWRRASQFSLAGADAAYDDMTAAWRERAALYGAVSKLYKAQARGVNADHLHEKLPGVGVLEAGELPPKADGLFTIVEESRRALRRLLALERKTLEVLLATTRGVEGARAPRRAWFEAAGALRGDAFSTALVSNLHPRRVEKMDLLRSNLLTDGALDAFFERAPVIRSALSRFRSAPSQPEAAPNR